MALTLAKANFLTNISIFARLSQKKKTKKKKKKKNRSQHKNNPVLLNKDIK